MHLKRILLISLLFATILPGVPARAQDIVKHTASAPYIEWIGQYPATTGVKPKRSLGTRIADFILGRKNSLELTRPVALVVKDSVTSFILDQENGVIFKVKDKVGEITQFKSRQYKTFPSLVGISRFRENSILFTDSYHNKIFVVNPEKKSLSLLSDSTFGRPTGIVWVPSERLIWLVETNAHRITVLDEKGRLVKRFGKRGNAPGEFNYPAALWIDKQGLVYVVDAMNFRVQIFSPEGEFISQFGKAGDGSGDFARPKGIATDSYGNIYIADAIFSAVQIFNRQGRLLYAFGTRGQGKGEFWMPSGIFIDNRDRIYVADSYNSRIQVFQLMNGGDK